MADWSVFIEPPKTRQRQSVHPSVQAGPDPESQTFDTPLQWAENHRFMPNGSTYSITHPRHRMPYLADAYAEMGQLPVGGRIVVMKCAQTGWTESAINISLWFMQTKGEGVLYMLPSDRALADFSQARLDRAIRASPYLNSQCQSVANTQLKMIFGYPLYLRGAHGLEKLREISVGMVVRDELQVMSEEGAELALHRLGASRHKYTYDLSNPEYPETGIHLEYLGGTQETWTLPCPRCSEWHEPRWPESMDFVSEALVCPNCGSAVDKAVGRWTETNPGAPYRSFRMSQLVSPTVAPGELVQSWKAAQGNATREQVFYNMTLGLPYAPEGARITEEILAALPRSGEMVAGYTRPTVMGVDVGAVNHVIIRRVEGGVLWAGTCQWHELDRLMGTYNVRHCGIDAMPETTMARQFAQRWPGKVRMVRYLHPTASGKRETTEDGVPVLQVSRTEALDAAFARLLQGEEQLPVNLPADVRKHWGALTRQIVKTGKTEYAAWVETGPDHYAHALAYSELVRDDRPPWEIAGLH